MKNLPIVAVTIGEASGIGPEILVKAFSDQEIFEVCLPIAIGDKKILDRACEAFNVDIAFHAISHPKDAVWDAGKPNLIDLVVKTDAGEA